MAKEDESVSISEKGLEIIERIFNSLWSNNTSQDIWHWLILALFIITIGGCIVIFLLKSFGEVIELLIKFIEIYKTSGLPVWLSKDNEKRVRRRKQFCAVLEADLAYLAKAENWNDQYFTDLEAEVESEGGYYASAIDKLRRKKSFGLRKERSLVRAITSSTERAMQLVGEPGSGKSVALRHLAKQLAEQGKKSNDKNATVPLYINLREMEFSNADAVNVDTVREFILDNIRRGDADTSAFVKENWDDYCNRGLWLFLFDSFDEIPAVLHSVSGDNIIRSYSQALRQFLEGMGECKGILASREFKGPEALPWKKLRILPLSGDKQDELIRNSFLKEEHMNLVRQHLAGSHSSIGSTPLFLTLLCRYVRDEQHAPSNDHDILLQHIERLAKREPDYLFRKYTLNPEELIIGAERLARLFAEDDTLSLAPSLDQIRVKLKNEELPGKSLENLISALVDSKIGRADVPNAAPGDRRFAFAHRRYQEALFVRYLTGHPNILSATELLTQDRWREYTVTLLQTCSFEAINSILVQASVILEESCTVNKYTHCGTPPLPEDLIYFDWTSEKAIPLLSLLQEGLAHRIHDVPEYLSLAASKFLMPRWEKGDSWDRCEVLRLGGLLPQDTLVACLVETFNHGTKSERQNAFRQAAFASKLPDEARAVVLRMLSDQVILAKNREELLTIEALAARLPSDMGANIVVSRGKRLRNNLEFFKKSLPRFLLINPFSIITTVANSMLVAMDMLPRHSLRHIKNNYQSSKIEIDFTFSFAILLASWIIITVNLVNKPTNLTVISFILFSLLILLVIIMFSPFLVRHQGKKIKFHDVMIWIIKHLNIKVFLKASTILIFFGAVFLSICLALGYSLCWLVKKFIPAHIFDLGEVTLNIIFLIGLVNVIGIFYLYIVFNFLANYKRIRVMNKDSAFKLRDEKNKQISDLSILYSAESYEQLIFWLHHDDGLISNTHSIRSFSSFIMSFLRHENYAGENPDKLRPMCLKARKPSPTPQVVESVRELKTLRQSLEDRFAKCSK
ncbi:NACHT domain-containing protein [Dickeya dadantii]|uniref:NACHT domain-containing protein n=1 Tax=Dickeya dadantii TaxID=204038 RepID=UPI0003A90485|nr:NACHT domain-containing protein [Dickeya dadantii]